MKRMLSKLRRNIAAWQLRSWKMHNTSSRGELLREMRDIKVKFEKLSRQKQDAIFAYIKTSNFPSAPFTDSELKVLYKIIYCRDLLEQQLLERDNARAKARKRGGKK